jgi:hypothetical protein
MGYSYSVHGQGLEAQLTVHMAIPNRHQHFRTGHRGAGDYLAKLKLLTFMKKNLEASDMSRISRGLGYIIIGWN